LVHPVCAASLGQEAYGGTQGGEGGVRSQWVEVEVTMETVEQRIERKAAIIFNALVSSGLDFRDMSQNLQEFYRNAARAIEASDATVQGWQPIESIPAELKDGRKVLVWHDHGSDPYYRDDDHLTIYGCHCEGLGADLTPGVHIAQFGGAYDGEEGYIPAWWFEADDDEWGHPLAPTHFMPLPAPPKERG